MPARASRSRSVLYVVVLSSVTLLAFGRVVAPVRGHVQDRLASLDAVGARAAGPVNRVAGKVLSYDSLKKENARLVAELDRHEHPVFAMTMQSANAKSFWPSMDSSTRMATNQ